MSIMIRRVANDRAMLRAKDGADELGFSLDELYDLGKTIFAFLGDGLGTPSSLPVVEREAYDKLKTENARLRREHDQFLSIEAHNGKLRIENEHLRKQRDSYYDIAGARRAQVDDLTERLMSEADRYETFRDYLLRCASRPVRDVIERAIRAKHV